MNVVKCPYCQKVYFFIKDKVCPFCGKKEEESVPFKDIFGDDNSFSEIFN